MTFDGLQGTETLVITTPVNVENATYTVVNLADPQNSREQYRCEFRGHTAVDVQRLVAGNDPHEHSWYRLFRREAMKTDAAPERPMPAYVHPKKLINWLMLVEDGQSRAPRSYWRIGRPRRRRWPPRRADFLDNVRLVRKAGGEKRVKTRKFDEYDVDRR